jgi:hypothetical protein
MSADQQQLLLQQLLRNQQLSGLRHPELGDPPQLRQLLGQVSVLRIATLSEKFSDETKFR